MKKYIIQTHRKGAEKTQQMVYEANERRKAFDAWDLVVDGALPGDRCELIADDGNHRVTLSCYYPCDRNYPFDDRGHE